MPFFAIATISDGLIRRLLPFVVCASAPLLYGCATSPLPSVPLSAYERAVDSLNREIATRERGLESLRDKVDSLAMEAARRDSLRFHGDITWHVPVHVRGETGISRVDSLSIRRAAELWTFNSWSTIRVSGIAKTREPDSLQKAAQNAMVARDALLYYGVSNERVYLEGVQIASAAAGADAGNVLLSFGAVAADEPGIPEPEPRDFESAFFAYVVPHVPRSAVGSITKFMTDSDWSYRLVGDDSLTVISEYVAESVPGERLRQAAYMLAVQRHTPRCSRIVFRWRVESRGDLEPAFVRQRRDREHKPAHRGTIRRFLAALGSCVR